MSQPAMMDEPKSWRLQRLNENRSQVSKDSTFTFAKLYQSPVSPAHLYFCVQVHRPDNVFVFTRSSISYSSTLVTLNWAVKAFLLTVGALSGSLACTKIKPYICHKTLTVRGLIGCQAQTMTRPPPCLPGVLGSNHQQYLWDIALVVVEKGCCTNTSVLIHTSVYYSAAFIVHFFLHDLSNAFNHPLTTSRRKRKKNTQNDLTKVIAWPKTFSVQT